MLSNRIPWIQNQNQHPLMDVRSALQMNVSQDLNLLSPPLSTRGGERAYLATTVHSTNIGQKTSRFSMNRASNRPHPPSHPRPRSGSLTVSMSKRNTEFPMNRPHLLDARGGRSMPLGFQCLHPGGMRENSPPFQRWVNECEAISSPEGTEELVSWPS